MTASPSPSPAAPRTGLWTLLALAAPIALSQLFQIANAIIDTVMAGHLGTLSLAAVSAGISLWVPVMTVMVGFLYLLTPTVGRLIGAGKPDEIGPALAVGLITGLSWGGLGALALWFGSETLFTLIGVSPEIVPEAVAYIHYVALGFPGFGLFLALRFLIEGFRMPRLITAVTILCAVVKGILTYGFLFGGPAFSALGLPVLGAVGCGLSTALVLWLYGGSVLVISLAHPRLRPVWRSLLARPAVSLGAVWRFCITGLPIALNLLSDYVVMAVVALAIATIGPVAISAHQISYTTLNVLLMIPIGIGMGGAVLVAQASGAGDRAQTIRWISLCLSVCTVLPLGLSALILLYPHQIAGLSSTDPAVVAGSVELLKIIGLLLTLDALVITTAFLLRGLGDHRGPFLITVFAHWGVSLPSGWLLGSSSILGGAMGAAGWWWGLLLGLSVALAASLFRLWSIQGKKTPDVTPATAESLS